MGDRTRGAVRGRSTLRALAGDRTGTVAIIFALALAPIVFMAGAALDYSGAANLKTHLQKATDGTNLALCQMAVNTSTSDLQAEAVKMMTGYLGPTAYSIDTIVTTTNPWTISMTTRSLFQTAIIKGLSSNFATIPVTADARCFGQPTTFEIALVLDNTGSMANSSGGQSKMQALQQASTNFVNYMFSDPKLGPKTRISLVPFAAAVAVDPTTYKSASWVDQSGTSPQHWSILQGGAVGAATIGANNRFSLFNRLKAVNSSWDWNGCFESLPFPLNTQDVAPTVSNPSSYYVPLFSVDESGAGGENPNNGHRDGSNNYIVSINSYLDDQDGTSACPTTTDEATRTGRACKYTALRNPKTSNGYITTGPNLDCTTRPLTRLTRSQSTLVNEISQMQPNGNTNIHEGFMWGWRTLSPNGIFNGGTADQTPVAYTTPFNTKVIVLMTDGANTWNASPFSDTQPNTYNYLQSYHSAYGYIKNPDGSSANAHLTSGNANPTTGVQTRAAIDALTVQACSNARSSPSNVIIYTIGFSVSSDPIDQQGLNLLTSCAGSSTRAFVANDSSSLQTIFAQIASSIGSLRLTN